MLESFDLKYQFFFQYFYWQLLLMCRVASDGVDIVLDCLCGEDTNRGISILKPMGKYVLYGEPLQPTFANCSRLAQILGMVAE